MKLTRIGCALLVLSSANALGATLKVDTTAYAGQPVYKYIEVHVLPYDDSCPPDTYADYENPWGDATPPSAWRPISEFMGSNPECPSFAAIVDAASPTVEFTDVPQRGYFIRSFGRDENHCIVTEGYSGEDLTVATSGEATVWLEYGHLYDGPGGLNRRCSSDPRP